MPPESRSQRAPLVLCLHESASTGRIWGPLADALAPGVEVVAPDRIGWGATPAPEGYARTTIAEQAAFAEARIERPVIVCGAGIGAVVALELLLRRPQLVVAAVAVEPPLLSFVKGATEEMSADAERLRTAFQDGGREAVLDAYLAGALTAMGAGADRIPAMYAERGPLAARTLVAELGAVPAWDASDSQLAGATRPSLVLTGADAPRVLDEAAAGLGAVLGRSQLVRLGPGHPHTDNAGELADAIRELTARVS